MDLIIEYNDYDRDTDVIEGTWDISKGCLWYNDEADLVIVPLQSIFRMTKTESD